MRILLKITSDLRAKNIQHCNMEKPQDPQPLPTEIPLQALSPETLQGVIESFIQREGTDYGAHEVALETKVQQILRQLHKGDVKIIFDHQTESVSLLTLNQWKRITKS